VGLRRSELRLVAAEGNYEHSNEPSSLLESNEFLTQLSDYQLRNKDRA
jgi:hypothetical protein